jgi:hypothetical protein
MFTCPFCKEQILKIYGNDLWVVFTYFKTNHLATSKMGICGLCAIKKLGIGNFNCIDGCCTRCHEKINTKKDYIHVSNQDTTFIKLGYQYYFHLDCFRKIYGDDFYELLIDNKHVIY